MTPGFSRSTALIALALAAACALLLGGPAETVTTKYVNDLFVFLDGVHRIDQGQVPNRDFHTALGPLNYYLPALGYWIAGTMGGAMPVGLALLVLGFAPLAAWILGSRLRPAIGIPLAAYLVLVLAVPANIGESIAALSFAMFYNRIGWAALGLLFVLYLAPARPGARTGVADALCATALVLLMIYTKISYGAVGLAFLVLLLLDRRQRGWAAAALAMTGASCFMVELVWRGSESHLSDLLLAGRVSGAVATADRIAEVPLRNLASVSLFALVAALALWRTRSVRDVLFYGFCGGSGLVLIGQNFQVFGIVTIGAGAAVAAEILARSDQPAAERKARSVTAGVHLLVLALLLPGIVQTALTLLLHAGLAVSNGGTSVPLPRFAEVRLVELWHGGEYPAFTRYFESIADGAAALKDLEVPPERVLVLDFVSPFAAGLGLRPVQGDSTWHHWSRTVDETHFLDPERLFRDVRVVLEPKWPIEAWTANGMRQLYTDHLAENYTLSHESADWKVYVARPSPAETVSRSDRESRAPRDARSTNGG
jgi:hypothetical protein